MTLEPEQMRTSIAVCGGQAGSGWLRALRGVDGVDVELIEGADALPQALARPDVEAIVLIPESTPDPVAAIRRVLMTGRSVLVAGAVPISPTRLLSLDAQARRRGRLLVFDTGVLGDERIEFVRKMIGGRQPIWRARYIRLLRTGIAGETSLDSAALGEVARVLALVDDRPARVSAVSPSSGEETLAMDTVMMSILFDGGLAARVDVSTVEPEPRGELVVACDDRTVMVDPADARAPLQVQTHARRPGSRVGGWLETINQRPPAERADRLARAAEAFVAAVRARDLTACNGRALAAASEVWSAARVSLARGSEFVEIGPRPQVSRPKLKLIVGGGLGAESVAPPELTLVGRDETAAPPEPLRSA
jgi:hypothetical protein